MQRLLILGAGQYGMIAKEIAEATGLYQSIEFLDDQNEIAIGKFSDIDQIDYDAAIVAIGHSGIREKWFSRIEESKAVALIHPMAIVMPSAVIEKGAIIEAGVVICSNAVVSKGTIVMSGTIVGSDAKIGNFCYLKYNCTVPERCIVADQTIAECGKILS